MAPWRCAAWPSVARRSGVARRGVAWWPVVSRRGVVMWPVVAWCGVWSGVVCRVPCAISRVPRVVCRVARGVWVVTAVLGYGY